MSRRTDILSIARWWSDYGATKASFDDLRYICDTAVRPDQGRDAGMPTDANILKSLKEDYGVYFGATTNSRRRPVSKRVPRQARRKNRSRTARVQ